MEIKELQEKALLVRQDIIRATYNAGSGHPGGSLSAVEVLVSLYFEVMNIDPKQPKMEGRDKFVLSKGHATPVLYSTLAERGFFDKKELVNFRKKGHMLQGHPSLNVPGVEIATGSLGQGISGAVGFALANRLNGDPGNVYVVLGDGEIQEGIVWEAAMAAAHYKLEKLIAIVDHNGLQIDGKNDDVMTVNPIDKKFEAFGWNVINVPDGHDFTLLLDAFAKAKSFNNGKPTCIVAETHKGHGVSFMEDNPDWHGKAPNKELAEQAMKELGGEL